MEKNIFKFHNSEIMNERVQIKRKYADYPAKTVNALASVRNQVLEFIGDKNVSNENLQNFFYKLQEERGNSSINKQWFESNEKYFVRSRNEGTVFWSLSKLGKNILENIKKQNNMNNTETKIGLFKTNKINESINQELNEADKLNLSEDLKKVKSAKDLADACANKYLVIHSSGELESNYAGKKKKKGGLPQVWILKDLNKSVIRKGSIYNGYGVFGVLGSGLYEAPYLTIEDVYEFFKVNKGFDNKIYTTPKLDIMDEIMSMRKTYLSNQSEVSSLLKKCEDVTYAMNKKRVYSSSYAVLNKGNYGSPSIEFTCKGNEYTVIYGSEDTRIVNSRSTAIAGYDRNETIFKVDAKTCKAMLDLFTENVEISKSAIKAIQSFLRREKVNPK